MLQTKPTFVFLSETLCKQEIVEKVRSLLYFEGSLAVDCVGHNGGLALFWSNKNEVQLMCYSKNHIDVMVDIDGWKKYRMTCLCGEPYRSKRQETWDLIRRLKNVDTKLWCLIRDVNNVLHQDDERGDRPYPQWLIQGFQRVLKDCDLNDLDLEG